MKKRSSTHRTCASEPIRVCFVDGENSMTSGAFRSMVVLCKILREDYGVVPFVITRYRGHNGKKDNVLYGDGIALLQEYGIQYKIIHSYDWKIPMDYEWTLIHRLKWIVKRLINDVASAEIALFAKAKKIDLIHINTTVSYVGLKASRIAGLPCIWHLREVLKDDYNLQFALPNALSIINEAECKIAISKFVYQKRVNCLSNLRLIYNGIDESTYKIDRCIFTSAEVHILLIGSFSGNKGHKILIQAADFLVKGGYTNFHVDFVGRGTREHQYIELVKSLGLNNYFTFNGSTENAVKYYSNTDIYVMASSAEAFGRTTVEAMMAGCLVIGGNCGATPEILDYGNAGVLFEKDNPESLAEKIKSVIYDKETSQKIAKKGQKFAMKNFTASKNAEQIYTLYKDVRGGGG